MVLGQSIDNLLKELEDKGFEKIGEYDVNGGEISLPLSALPQESLPGGISHEYRIIDKTQIDPSHGPRETFVVYRKSHASESKKKEVHRGGKWGSSITIG